MGVKLSIIVPVYNVRAYLEKCIESILAQTFEDYEVILVDDGSTDGSGELCDEFLLRDGRIRVIHNENGGVVRARKTGISAAKGEYVGYVDSDDWIDEHMYETMVNCMDQYGCDFVMCDVTHESKALPLSSGGTAADLEGGYYDRERMEKQILPRMIYAGEFYKFGVYPVIWNKIFRREKLMKHQLAVDDDIRTGEDAACVYPYILSADSMYFFKDKFFYHYRRSENQLTSAYDEQYFDRIKTLCSFLSHSELSHTPCANQLDYYYAYLIKTTVSNELKALNKKPLREKVRSISEICEFTKREGFLDRLNISAFHHRLYFDLLSKNKPVLLTIGVYAAKCIQKIFK